MHNLMNYEGPRIQESERMRQSQHQLPCGPHQSIYGQHESIMKQFKPKMYPAVAIREADLLLAATVPKPRMNDSQSLSGLRVHITGF